MGWFYSIQLSLRISNQERDLTSHSLLSDRYSEAFEDAAVLGGVDLDSALYQIQWHNGCVGETARQHASESTESIVLPVSKLTTVFASVYEDNTQSVKQSIGKT